MLQGTLIETQYAWPDSKLVNEGHGSPLQPTKESLLSCDEVTYITDGVSIPILERSLDLLTRGTARSSQNLEP